MLGCGMPTMHYEFGPFRLDAVTRALYRGTEFIALTPKAAEILVLLVQETGRVVTRDQLMQAVWPGVVVEEGTIANNISALRKVLEAGEFGREGPIATVSRRGYRFTAEVRESDGAPPSARTTAHPAISDRDTIVVGEIENRTGDPVFDGTMRQAVLLHLGQSPYLEVIGDRKMLAVLGYMGKPNAPVSGEIALEVCQRTGARAVITGSIFAFGDEYLIGLQSLHGETGGILLTEQARARGKAEVLSALDTAAVGLRTKLGESLASIQRFSRPLQDATTPSLDALKAYSVGRSQWLNVGEAAGKPHYLRAIEIDPDFGSAYGALALVCNNMGQTDEAMKYARRYYELRDRLDERERMRGLATYHTVFTGDLFSALDALNTWEANYPRDSSAANNLANAQMQLGHWDQALAATQRAFALEPTNVSASNLVVSLLAVGRNIEARTALQDAFARGLDAFYLHLDAYQEAFLRADAPAMKKHLDAVTRRPTEEDFLIAAEADTEAYHGRFGRARELSRRAVASARDAQALEMAAMWEAVAALREAEIGDRDRAVDGAHAALDTFHGRDVDCLAALALARCGEVEEPEALMKALDGEHPQHTIVQRLWLPCIRSALALAEKDWERAAEALEPARAVELAQTTPFENGFMIAPYLRGIARAEMGRLDEAINEFTKILDRPGLVKTFVLFPLAHLRASKAMAAAGRDDEAAQLRSRFDAMWKSADVAIPA